MMKTSSVAKRVEVDPPKKKKPNVSDDEDDDDDNKKKSKKDKKKRNISKVEVDDEYKKVIEACVYYMERMNYSLIAFFRRCDKNSDFHISLSEFAKTLSSTVEYEIEDDMCERVFQRFA